MFSQGLTAQKVPRVRPTKVAKKGKDDEERVEKTVGWEDTPRKGPIKPENQQKLTEAELNEDITRILKAINPHAPQNIVRYSFKDNCYKPVVVEQVAVHFVSEGSLIHKDSDEAKRMIAGESLPAEETEPDEEKNETLATPVEDGGEVDGAGVGVGEEDRPDSVASKTDKNQKKCPNQINFSERASQTLNNPLREKSIQTEPPPRTNFSANANQWENYDAHVEELLKLEKNKEKQKDTLPERVIVTENDNLPKVGKSPKIFERMVHQNIFDEKAQNFKYFEDASDDCKGQEGTLLPLWKFQYEEAKTLSVTAICWNNKFEDLFAVGMGSYDFRQQGFGMVVFYSFKNSSFPEFFYPTKSGVLCLDIHKQNSNLVAVGFYDGCVAVYNLSNKGVEPVHKSTATTGKHTHPVWQVRWQNDDMDNNHNFYSVSSDGRVVSWTLVRNELLYTDIIRLSVIGAVSEGPDDAQLPIFTCGLAFDFHKEIDSLFLVGTEGGKIHQCSKTYSSHILETYNAHSMAVGAVKWNCFHPKVFISGSLDWTVKIWNYTVNIPLLTFDLNAAIGDVSWSPYSSTVFGAVTADGKVHVFDLSINKYEPICRQSVAAKGTKLTHLEFNPMNPTITVGDDRGYINSFKLSPNLRSKPKAKKGQELPQGPEVEVAKMEKLLNLLQEM